MPQSGRFPRSSFALSSVFLLLAARAAAQQAPPLVAPATPPADLRTFVVEKPPADLPRASRASSTTNRATSSMQLAPRHDTLRTTLGLGYVQDADWGAETVASGAVSGVQIVLDSLVTKGRNGYVLDRGFIKLAQGDTGWRAEGGDIFSSLTGPSRGARVSWLTSGGREPSLSAYGSMPGLAARPTIVAYRDQLRVHGQTLLDAEVGSDKSHFLRTRLSAARIDLEASYRHAKHPTVTRESGVQVAARLWRGAGLGVGHFRIDQLGERAASTTLLVRMKPARFVELSVERAIATYGGGVNATTTAIAHVNAGQLQVLQRYQWGVSRFTNRGLEAIIEREQLQSFASYTTGPRLSVALQSAVEWRDSGPMPHWQELQTTARLTKGTRLQIAAPVPHLDDTNRLRAMLTQALGQQFSLQVEYGRLAPYQSFVFASDRPRFKVMLHRALKVPTPARGGEVRGSVVDEVGRAVSGARVTLGPYAANSGHDGEFVFDRLPRGEYDLALDPNHLPADYAWDGRQRRLTVLPSSRLRVALLVAPLNAIHGRVYADRNLNGRFDAGEGVSGAVLRVDDRVTSTDPDGGYSFYNVWPGKYVIRLDIGRLPASVEPRGATALAVTLEDGRPVIGADFLVADQVKPIIWKDIK